MSPAHRTIQLLAKKRLADSGFSVRAETEDGKNRLPDSDTHWYEPDVVARDQRGSISYIVEVEGDPVRKALVGAMVLADKTIAAMKQAAKPTLYFVIHHPNGLRQIENFRSKVELTREYCRHLANVQVITGDELARLRFPTTR
jgi:hypothetical protein